MSERSAERERPAESHRLFLALWPGDEVRAVLDGAVDGVEAFRDAGRRVPASKLHLTLHFLGGWVQPPDDVVGRVRAAVASVQAGAFHLVIDRAGGFRGARVGWLAPGGNSGLDALWSALGHALDAAEIPTRRHARFTPHVTVLRGFTGAVEETPVDAISWPVGDFVLVHSHDGRYDVVARWPLEPA